VLLGIAIWLFLPHKVSTCKLLTPQEQQHLQAAIDGSIPPTTAAPVQISACTPKNTILASDVSSRGSSHGSIDGSSSDGSSNAGSAVERSLGSIGGGRAGSQYAMAAGMQQMKAEGAPNMQQLLADLRAAAGHRVVWCSSFWRFLYLLTLNGLIFWYVCCGARQEFYMHAPFSNCMQNRQSGTLAALQHEALPQIFMRQSPRCTLVLQCLQHLSTTLPTQNVLEIDHQTAFETPLLFSWYCRVPLIVHELLDVPTSNAAQASAQQTHTMLLAAVPYVAGVATHVVNALHSHRVHERRWVLQAVWMTTQSHRAALKACRVHCTVGPWG
jgi:hypothetical protein